MRISDWSSDVCSSDLTAASDASWRASIGRQDAMHVVAGVVQLAGCVVQVVQRRLHHHRQQQAQAQQQHDGAEFGNARMREMPVRFRSEEHKSELQSLMRISYDAFCLKKKEKKNHKYQLSYNTRNDAR